MCSEELNQIQKIRGMDEVANESLIGKTEKAKLIEPSTHTSTAQNENIPNISQEIKENLITTKSTYASSKFGLAKQYELKRQGALEKDVIISASSNLAQPQPSGDSAVPNAGKFSSMRCTEEIVKIANEIRSLRIRYLLLKAVSNIGFELLSLPLGI